MLFQASTHSSLTFKEQNTFVIVFEVFFVHTTTGQACVNSRTDHRYHCLIHPGDDQTALHPQRFQHHVGHLQWFPLSFFTLTVREEI